MSQLEIQDAWENDMRSNGLLYFNLNKIQSMDIFDETNPMRKYLQRNSVGTVFDLEEEPIQIA